MINIEGCKTCRNCPSRWKNFDSLNDEQIKLIDENRFEAQFKAGEVIFKQGSPTSNAIFLVNGLTKIYMEGDDGKNIIIAIAKPGELIAGPGTYVDNRHHYTLSAIKDTTACFVSMSVIKKLVLENSLFAEGYLKDISYKSLQSFKKLLSHNQRKMHGRLAEGLLHLSGDIFESEKFACCLSRQELGELTGMTKESVVRLLKEFHSDKIINIKGNEIEIINQSKLAKIMQSG